MSASGFCEAGTEAVGAFCRLYDLTSDDDIEEESELEAARAAADCRSIERLPGQLQRDPDRQSRKRGRSTSPAAGVDDGSPAASSPTIALGSAPIDLVPAMQPQLAAAAARQHTAAPMAAAPSARAASQRQGIQLQHSVAAAHAAQRPPDVQQPRHAAVATTAERGAQQSHCTVASQQPLPLAVQSAAPRQAVPMAPPRAAVQTAQQPQPRGAEPAQRPHTASDARRQPAASSAAQVRLACRENMSLFGDSLLFGCDPSHVTHMP